MPDDGRTRTSGRGAAGPRAAQRSRSASLALTNDGLPFPHERTSLPERTDWTGRRTDADVRGGQALSRLMD